jgi:hypothetical protein
VNPEDFSELNEISRRRIFYAKFWWWNRGVRADNQIPITEGGLEVENKPRLPQIK